MRSSGAAEPRSQSRTAGGKVPCRESGRRKLAYCQARIRRDRPARAGGTIGRPDSGSRPDGQARTGATRLEALAVAAAQVHLGAVLQADAPVAADPRCHLGHPRDVDHVGFVHPDEPLGIELAFEPGERGADLAGLAADMQDGVVSRRLDPVDVGHLDHDLLPPRWRTAKRSGSGSAGGSAPARRLRGSGRTGAAAGDGAATSDAAFNMAIGHDVLGEFVGQPVEGERKAMGLTQDAAEPQQPQRRHAERMERG